ncbi:hypothetical protein AB0N17_05100 [Streptomyces sp. NPDC051133]|uniref:hypothetical protein n=1 Tax=Streptomyces sp. NPDC051133 TaxID=3155521 RepID=UPI003413BAF5
MPEIGTSNGCAAIWFADALRDTGGLLTTVEYRPQLRRVLTPHGVVAVDNAVSHREQVAALRELPRADPEFDVQLHELATACSPVSGSADHLDPGAAGARRADPHSPCQKDLGRG